MSSRYQLLFVALLSFAIGVVATIYYFDIIDRVIDKTQLITSVTPDSNPITIVEKKEREFFP